MKKICFVTTSPLIVNFFLVPHLLFLRERYAMSLALPHPGEVTLADLPGVEVIPVDIPRPIRPLADLRALLRLRAVFRERRFALVHSFGPKAGLLSTWAGLLAGVPARLHTFTGQVWAARTGPSRALLKTADRAIARMATHVLTDSPSQRDFLASQGIVRGGACLVLGSGSVSGVDLARFRPDFEARRSVREELGIPPAARVVLFLGRLRRDKGILDLAEAFGRLIAPPDAVLLLVGPDEEGLRSRVIQSARNAAGRVRFVDYTRNPERYLAASDLLCLPSYREGFGTVVIEAAAAGVAALGTRIYGISDALIDGETGLLFEPGDVQGLCRELERLLADDALRARLAAAARARARAEFAQKRLTAELASLYEKILSP